MWTWDKFSCINRIARSHPNRAWNSLNIAHWYLYNKDWIIWRATCKPSHDTNISKGHSESCTSSTGCRKLRRNTISRLLSHSKKEFILRIADIFMTLEICRQRRTPHSWFYPAFQIHTADSERRIFTARYIEHGRGTYFRSSSILASVSSFLSSCMIRKTAHR